MRRFYVGTLLTFVWGMMLVAGCARTADQRLAHVQRRQDVIHERIAADEKRAAELRAEVKQLEQTVDVERRCLELQEC